MVFKIIQGIVLFAAFVVAGFLMPKPALGDHPTDNCTLTGPQTYMVSPELDQAPWQLAQREVNWSSIPNRQFLTQVPYGGRADIFVLPWDSPPHTTMWVQRFCNSGQSIIWVDRNMSSYAVGISAAHEFVHHWGVRDHIHWSSRNDPYRNGDGHAIFCDGPEADDYTGIESYCHYKFSSSGWWGISYPYRWQEQDQELLRRMWK